MERSRRYCNLLLTRSQFCSNFTLIVWFYFIVFSFVCHLKYMLCLCFLSISSLFIQVYKLVKLVILMFENLSAIRNFCEIHHKEIEEMSSLLHLVTK